MNERVYEVLHKSTGVSRLVIAGNAAQAVRHVAKDTFDVCVPSTLDALAIQAKGVTVESASAEAAEAELRG